MRSAWTAPDPAAPNREDHFIALRGSWNDYERVLEMRGERSAPRIAYLDGTIEIMSASIFHEGIRSTIGRLVETFCDVNGIEFSPYGAWTLKRRPKEAGVEADECYVLGDRAAMKRPRRPDLAIEVVWTGGLLRKEEIYRRLKIPELWIWERERIRVVRLKGDEYVSHERSALLPSIDLAQLASFIATRPTSAAMRAYRKALTRPRPKRRR